MPKIYCPNCYSDTSYSSVKPEKCQKCGKSYLENNITASKPPISVIKVKPSLRKEIEQDLEDDGFGDEFVPEIDKLEVEIPKNLRTRREHISSVAFKGELGIPRRQRKTGKGSKKVSKSKVEKDWANNFKQNDRKNPIEIG